MNVWREWLTFSKAEQRGFFILIVLCLTLLLVLIIGQCRSPRDGQIIIRQFNAMSNGKDSSPQFYDTLHVNTATVTEMSRFGFSDRLIINVLKYREAGGRYKHFSDFRKTYGFDSTNSPPLIARLPSHHADFYFVAPRVCGIHVDIKNPKFALFLTALATNLPLANAYRHIAPKSNANAAPVPKHLFLASHPALA